MINVVGLTKYYGQNCAVKDLTFNAKKGEILGFLGPNGAGKTTTMRILTGYMPPSSGSVQIGGLDVIEHSLEVRRMIGYLPETVPLYPEMRVWDYLEFMGRLRRVENLDERIEEVMEQVGMEEREDSYISKLSKGMRQRVGLAQALIHQPEVLILDEPTIGLDPAQIIEVRRLIQEIGRQKTVMLSTHILSEAQQICDRVLIINRGQLVAEDTPERLQRQISGRQKVTVQVESGPEQALEVVKSLPEVASASVNERGRITIESAGDADIRSRVVAALSAAGLGILEIYSETVNLEDIFLQLTKEAEVMDEDEDEDGDNGAEDEDAGDEEGGQ